MSFEPALPPKRTSDPREALAQVVAAWWGHSRAVGAADGEIGDFARLRSLGRTVVATGHFDMGAALRIHSVRRLCGILAPLDGDPQAWTLTWGRSVALTAVVLAHVAVLTPGPMGEVLRGLRGKASDARIADARIDNFLREDSAVGLLRRSLPLLAMLQGAAPAGELGAALLLWFDDPAPRRRWAEAYYGLHEAGRPAARSAVPQ